MKVITNNRFSLNGVEEKILKAPKDRNDDVTFTTGGFKEHATTMPLLDFEAQTGYCIAGLEPEIEFELENEIKSLISELKKRDMTINKSNHAIVNSGIEFTNSNNSTLHASFSLSERDDEFFIRVNKNNSLSGKIFSAKN